MLNIQGTGRNQKISARHADGQVSVVKDCIAVRKHVIHHSGWKEIQSYQNVFAFVSSPKIYRQNKLLPYIKGWCHPFRKPGKWLPKNVPSILLPESDFLDSNIVFSSQEHIDKKYDFFYFTINAKPGIENKGLHVFLNILPTLAQMKLKGIVIVYFPNAGTIKRFTVSLNNIHRNNLRRYGHILKFHWGILNSNQMDMVMRQCRFGLFPNTVDNSPRIIAESLIRDVPILVNNNIHGGWHYVNSNTGVLFTEVNLKESIEYLMSNKLRPKDYYHEHFGFEKSAKKLATFLNGLFGYEYTHVYFKAFEQFLRKIA